MGISDPALDAHKTYFLVSKAGIAMASMNRSETVADWPNDYWGCLHFIVIGRAAKSSSCPSRMLDLETLERLDRALIAATIVLADARHAFDLLSGRAPEEMEIKPPILLTVSQVCRLLGYKKTKVYELMRRGLLPYVHTETGRRRVEYRAAQRFVKRLRVGRLERRVS